MQYEMTGKLNELARCTDYDKIPGLLDEIGVVKDTAKRLQFLYDIMCVRLVFHDGGEGEGLDELEDDYSAAKYLLSLQTWRP